MCTSTRTHKIQNIFEIAYVYMQAHMTVGKAEVGTHTHFSASAQRSEALGSLEVTCSCEPHIGTENQTEVLCKRSVCF